MSNPALEFVYRLATAAEWRAAQQSGVVPLREIDQCDGYVHLSTREQALDTAARHFVGADDLLALEIPMAKIAANVKFELAPKRGETFPHLYDVLRIEAVSAVITLRRNGEIFSYGDAL